MRAFCIYALGKLKLEIPAISFIVMSKFGNGFNDMGNYKQQIFEPGSRNMKDWP
jgi:hypothetical protein